MFPFAVVPCVWPEIPVPFTQFIAARVKLVVRCDEKLVTLTPAAGTSTGKAAATSLLNA
jgi:hypothetical protein